MEKASQGRPASVRKTATRSSSVNYSKNEYVQGNAVRVPDVKTAILEQPRKQTSQRVQKNREKVFHMSVGYVMFLSVALLVSALVLIVYINLQAQISTSVQNISMLESKLNGLKLENDEEYNRIVTSIDLDEIKRIAIEELGMTYASQGQIIELDKEGSDYVRQYSQIP